MPWGHMPSLRDNIERGLVTKQTTEMRGGPDGTADITSKLQRGHARGQRRCRTTGGSTRRAGKIMWIMRGAVNGVIGLQICAV
jgi:hypothetical protein